MNNPDQKLFVLEGNIGAGKSTFLKVIQQQIPNVDIIPEPTDKWQSISEKENLLDLFYKDKKRWSYTFQSYAFISRINAQAQHAQTKGCYQILERSVYCDRYCFAKNLYEMGDMSDMEWEIYTEWFSWLAKNYAPTPSGFIYLRAEPKVCKQRIEKRSRTEEGQISLAYLESLHSKHEDWLVDKKGLETYLVNIPVLVLDCNEEFESSSKRQDALTKKVMEFIESQAISSIALATKELQKQL